MFGRIGKNLLTTQKNTLFNTSSKVQFTRSFADAAAASGLRLTFATPAEVFFNKKDISQVRVPGISGEFGILQEHVPTIAELKPGIVTVHHVKEGKELEDKWFISGGFAFVYKDSQCTVSAVEAAPLDNFDVEAAKDGFKKYSANLVKAANDEERAKAMIGVELHQALCSALGVAVA